MLELADIKEKMRQALLKPPFDARYVDDYIEIELDCDTELVSLLEKLLPIQDAVNEINDDAAMQDIAQARVDVYNEEHNYGNCGIRINYQRYETLDEWGKRRFGSSDIETKERAELARLKAKYEGVV